MTAAAVPWPPALVGTPAIEVIERAIGRGRLSHSLLLAGDDQEGLSATGLALADRLLSLGAAAPSPYPPDRHPDCFQIRPAGKSRQKGPCQNSTTRCQLPSQSTSNLAGGRNHQ